MHIANIIDLDVVKARNELNKAKPKEENKIAEETAEIVNKIFVELKGIFPGWRASWPSDSEYGSAKRHWVKTFMDMKVDTSEHIERGLSACRKKAADDPDFRRFVVDAATFCDLCNVVATHDFPSPHVAIKVAGIIAANDSFNYIDKVTETVIRYALTKIDVQNFKMMSEKDAFKWFSHYYAEGCKYFSQGKIVLPKESLPEKAAPHPFDKTRNDAARAKCMDDLRKLGLSIQKL